MIELIIYPNPQPPNPAPNPLSLAGGTMSLIIPSSAPPSAADPYPGQVAMTIDASDPNPVNQFAFYVARPGIDFAQVGAYTLQARLTFPGGAIFETGNFVFTVTNESEQITTLALQFTPQRASWPPYFPLSPQNQGWFQPTRPWT
jgi:hypothetical protein